MNIILWIVQVLLALLFLFAGVTKFIFSVEEMNRQAPVVLPGIFLHFIGICEILGALGLTLPSALRIEPQLTSWAAAGLAIIMVGATVFGLMGPVKAAAVFTVVILLLCLFVAYGRWRLRPISAR